MEPDVIEFLSESNAIEGVYDDQSLEDAIEAWRYLIKRKVLTIKAILETHAILMKNQKLDADQIGQFRDIDVYIGGRRAMNPGMIGPNMWKWTFEVIRAHPAPDWKAAHVEFERIHPFVDGNGRVGRIFMNWMRVVRCGLPVLIIREDERQAYYEWFRA